MSILSDLENIDLSALISARASISGSVEDPEVQVITTGGAEQATLGGIGEAIGALRAVGENPEDLLKPLLDALGDLAGPLLPDDVPLDDYINAVNEGAQIVADIMRGFDGGLEGVGDKLGIPLGNIGETINSFLGDFTQVQLDQLGPFRDLLSRSRNGLSGNPQQLAAFAIEALLPFPKDSLQTLRSRVDGIISDTLNISIRADRFDTLRQILADLSAAARANDTVNVQVALQNLSAERSVALAGLRTEMAAIATRISGLNLRGRLQDISALLGGLRSGQDGVIEFMERIRTQVRELHAFIDMADEEHILGVVPVVHTFLDRIETVIREEITNEIDQAAAEVKNFVRNLLGYLGLRELRGIIHEFFQRGAQAIREADLDRFADDIRALLTDIRQAIADLDLEDEIAAAIGHITAVINTVADVVGGALTAIAGVIDTLAESASGILEQVVAVLDTFKQAIDAAAEAIENLEIENATQLVIDAIQELSDKGQELLSEVELPDALRPVIEQVIREIEGLDLEALIREPVHDALEKLQLPAEVQEKIFGFLQKAAETIANLIPTQVIEDITAEIEHVQNTILRFDSAGLADQADQFIGEVADFVENLNPGPALNLIRQPFVYLLELVDKAHPANLLKPVTDAYDNLLGSIDFLNTSPEQSLNDISSAMETQGENLGRTFTQPIRSLAGENNVSTSAAGETPGEPPELPLNVRPGDMIRFFGFIPNKLREALQALDAGPAGDAIQSINRFCGGLAYELRRMKRLLYTIEDRLEDQLDSALFQLGDARLEAHIALQGSTALGPVQLSAALDLLVSLNPATMRAELDAEVSANRSGARQSINRLVSELGGALDTAATLLESSRLASIGESLEELIDALDPEPIAAELDALVLAAYQKFLGFLPAIEESVQEVFARLQRMLAEFNPAAQLQKFLGVIDIIKEELAVLSPHTLVAELAGIHTAIREVVLAYDPAGFADEISAILHQVAVEIRGLNVGDIIRAQDLSALDAQVNRIRELDIAGTLSGVGEDLAEVGEALRALNPAGILEAVGGLRPRIENEFMRAVEAVRQELLALIRSLQYAGSGGAVSASASIG